MAQTDFTRIAPNIGATNALNSLRNVNNRLGIHQQRLATGRRINSASDDPADLTIATKLDGRSEGVKQALANIDDAKSLLSENESGLRQISDTLVQMRNKAEAAAGSTVVNDEGDGIVTPLKKIVARIDNIADQPKWNDTKPSDGSSNINTVFTFQSGADQDDTNSPNGLQNVKASACSGLNVVSPSTITPASSVANLATYENEINSAMDTVSKQSSKDGLLSARLTFKENQFAVAQVNGDSSYNRIMNSDMAFEQLEATKLSILQQTATTMLAQANSTPQWVQALLR